LSRLAIAALFALVFVAPARATAATRHLLDDLAAARVVALGGGPSEMEGAFVQHGAEPRIELQLPALETWPAARDRDVASLGVPRGWRVRRLDVVIPTPDATSVALAIDGVALPRFERNGAPSAACFTSCFTYQPGGFVPRGLYFVSPPGAVTAQGRVTVRHRPDPAAVAQRAIEAGATVPATALLTHAADAQSSRPALFVPFGAAIEFPVTPQRGERLRSSFLRRSVSGTRAVAPTRMRVGVASAGATTWIAEQTFRDAPADVWNDVDLDLDRWAGQPVKIRIEVERSGPGAIAPHFAADPRIAAAGDARPNLLLVVVDGLRADRVSPSASSPLPEIARLAREGVFFTEARSAAPWTRASIATLFTGVLPSQHGVETEAPDDALPDALPTLAQQLRAAGYETAAFSANLHLDPAFGLTRGFGESRAFHEDGSEVVARALRWIETARAPWFAFVFIMDTHHPWRHRAQHDLSSGIDAPLRSAAELGAAATRRARGVAEPTPDEVRKLVALYDENARYADAQLGVLRSRLAQRGELERTLLVVTADHGEAFGEHGDFFHGYDLYDELVRVPLVVRGPGIPAAQRRDAVSLADLGHSLLRWLAVPGAQGLPGRDLRTPCEGPPEACASFFETRFRGADLAGVAAPPWKLVLDRKTRGSTLFELARDPLERSDASAADGKRAHSLQQVLTRRLAEARRARVEGGASSSGSAIDPATAEALRALGYVTD
jgi:arylsulfatase A-like enzyme